MERTTPREHYVANRGFTLTELLIAMAIFTILMSGLAAMFNSAVTATRQGYASINAFENARSAMTTIDRDLSGAFVSAEFGDVYSFYGRPDGFMFVGVLDNGQLGRVTYVFHPEKAKPAFETTMSEQWGFVEQNVRRQFQRLAWENGSTGAVAQADVQTAVDALNLAYGGPYPATQVVEFSVRIATESLIRFEESVTDLDTFDMVLDSQGAGVVGLPWDNVFVDSIDPVLDDTVLVGDPVYGQFTFLLNALDATPLADPTDDLRNVYGDITANGGWTHPVTGDNTFLRVLGRETFDTLLRAKKREFWIRMLSGEGMGVVELEPTLAATDATGTVDYWYDEGYGVVNSLDRRILNEYVVADGIIGRAEILDPSTGGPLVVFGEVLDALDAQVKFSYGDGKNGDVYYFNAAENLANPDNLDGSVDTNGDGVADFVIPNMPTMLKAGGYGWSEVLDADSGLADNLLNVNRTRKNLGSPLLPRLPVIVTPELWVTRSRTRPGAPDFRRRFVQGIQVPAGEGRTPSTIIARSPGQAL